MKINEDLYIVGIVGVVAFVGIFIMLSGANNEIADVENNGIIQSTSAMDETGLAANVVSTSNVQSSQACSDSDRGYVYTVPGKVKVIKKSRTYTYTDTCSGNIIREYSCKKSSVTVKNYTCPYGCLNGACIRESSNVTTYKYHDVCGDSIVGFEEECDGSVIRSAGGFTLKLYKPSSSSTGTSERITAEGREYTIQLVSVNAEYNSVIVNVSGVMATLTAPGPKTVSGITLLITNIVVSSSGQYVTFLFKGSTIENCANLPGDYGNYDDGILSCNTDCKYDRSGCISEVTCSDSDGGLDYYTPGKGTGPYSYTRQMNFVWGEDSNMCGARIDAALGTSIYYDCCSDSTQYKQLNEVYCENGVMVTVGYDCPYGCSFGACVSDTGKNTLRSYPEFLFDDSNRFIGQVVVGERAMADDVTYAADIAASLFRTTSGDVTIVPIPVGVAVLDSEASYTEPSIIINIPCVNTFAAYYLGMPAQCSEGYEPGIGRLDFLIKNGQSAIIVGGYNSADIQAASRVLAQWSNYESYAVSGKSLCVASSRGLNNISVYPCTPLKVAIPLTCTDSDGGYSPYRNGDTCYGNMCQADYCDIRLSKNLLVEAVCENNLITQKNVTCSGSTPYCYEGTCSSLDPACSDSDGGQNPNVLGSVKVHHLANLDPYTDYCEIGTTPVASCSGSSCSVREFYCAGLMVGPADIPCPGGCNNGVCVKQLCKMPACVGAYNTGRNDSYGCPIYECPICPQYIPPAPGWCENGTIVPGITDSNGCVGTPRCFNDTTPRLCAIQACAGVYNTGRVDSYGCPIYACPVQQPCKMPACVGAYNTGRNDSYGCPIYECPVQQPCKMPACVGAYNTGRNDSYGCPIYECPVCAVYDMIPGWCENGTIVAGLVDNRGCPSAPMCFNDTTPKCTPVVEKCNGIDDDCDGSIDEGTTYSSSSYIDKDGDGVYVTNGTIKLCIGYYPQLPPTGDCNDNNARVYPGATEVCNGINDDCDNSIDENLNRNQSCTLSNGMGILYSVCSAGSWFNSSCAAVSCNPGYIKVGSSCVSAYCNDSDGGVYYDTVGVLKYGGIDYTDYCQLKTPVSPRDEVYRVTSCNSESGCYLIENYCTNSTMGGWTYYKCPNGCSNGICMPSSPSLPPAPGSI